MLNNHTCTICDQKVELLVEPRKNIPKTKCKDCGTFFETSISVIYFQTDLGNETKKKIKWWIAGNNLNGKYPELSKEALELASNRPNPTVVERAERLLLTIFSVKNNLGDTFQINEIPRVLAASFSTNFNELTFLVNFLVKQDWLTSNSTNRLYQITPCGHIEVDKLTRGVPQESDKAFVAMSFAKELTNVYEKGFQVGIENAGYEPVRIDRKEHINKIDDEIIVEIKNSAFVVADFTKHRGGVYFEAGFGLGMNLPVIWSCKEDDLNNLHFDIRQYNMILWNKNEIEELARRLQHRIEAILGKGPNLA